MNRGDFQRLAEIRAREAEYLLSEGMFDGGYYLLGYVVECALKACIAKNVQQYDFPDRGLVNESYTHDLRRLLRTAGLDLQLDRDTSIDSELGSNWAITIRWTEASRYEIHSQRDANVLRDAVLDQQHGVFQWIRQYW